MGKLVAFWSPYEGKAKVTSSMCAIIAHLGLNYPELEIAVSHTGGQDFSLEEKIDMRNGSAEEKQELYKRTGVAALKLQFRQAALSSEKIRRSAINLRMNSLFLYPNADRESDDVSFWILSKTLKDEFDLVFLDLENGKQKDTWRYLESADLIVVILPQEPRYLERLFSGEVMYPEEKKMCVIIGGYINTAKCGKRFLQRKCNLLKKNTLCGLIPLNSGFFDAMTEGKVLDYFYRNQQVRWHEENYEFIVQTGKTAENIRKKIFS